MKHTKEFQMDHFPIYLVSYVEASAWELDVFRNMIFLYRLNFKLGKASRASAVKF